MLWYAEYYNNIKDHVLKTLRARDDVGLIVDDYELEELYSLINAEYTRDLLWLETQKQSLKEKGK